MSSKFVVPIIATALVVTVFCGCETMSATQKGAAGGAAAGALAGQIIGGDTESTLIGAGVGAIGGALLNDHYDRKQQQAYEAGRQQGKAEAQSQK
jgi:hypothetical protein